MDTIKKLFNDRLFRIPDYQRGYSWEKSHLDDFWQDLSNLQENKIHYTGMISVEEVSDEEYNKWENDKWIIQGRNDTPLFIVDGQQRLTTIIILLWVIINRLDEDDELSYDSKSVLIEKYIYKENVRKGFKSYVFGYHKDNPSYEFLKREIFEQDDYKLNTKLTETAYTNNLLFAKHFFSEKISPLNLKELEKLYNKVTKQLKFDFKILEKELDIFIVFETMNNRGKPLSNLERLKNRLIYLSTLFNKKDGVKNELREEINDRWKIIYEYLGLNKDRRLEDDTFLQHHWIMYHRYERREPEFYAKDIFEKIFTTHKVLNGDLIEKDIREYIESISEGVKQWFIMYNPSHPHALELTKSKELLFWLKKQNRLGFKSFAPLILGAFLKNNDVSKKIELIKAIESYVFLIFNVSFRRSNTGTYHFNAKASELYREELTVDDIIKDISFWTYGNNDYHGYFDADNFHSFIKDLFLREQTFGFFDWKYLRYFLYEYEIYLNGNSEKASDWDKFKEIHSVYPQVSTKACWKKEFGNLSSSKQKRLKGSLGNLILSSTRNLDLNNLCFEEKKPFFANGLSNEEELLSFDKWNYHSILKRGIQLLDFMEVRWNVDLGDDESKKELLFLDFESNI